MARFARIVQGVVQETVDIAVNDALANRFTPELVAQFVPCLGNVAAGYTTADNVNFTAPQTVPDPPAPSLDAIYDQVVIDQRVLKAVVLCIIGGTLTNGMTPAQAKAAIKAKM